MFIDEEYYEQRRDELIDDRLCEGLCIRCCKPRSEYENLYVPVWDGPGKPSKYLTCAPKSMEIRLKTVRIGE